MWDFVANATVDSLSTVPDQFKGLYAEKDGKFSISDTAKGLVEAYVGQTNALNKTRKDLKSANDESASRRVTGKALAEFLKEHGVETVDEEDPITSLKAFTSSLLDSNKKNKEVTVNLDKIKAETEKRIKEVTDAGDAKVGKMKGALHKYLVNQAATAALAEAKGNIELLLDRVTKNTRVVEEGEDFVVRIVDDAGEVRSNGAGGYMDIKGFVAELKTQPSLAVAFASEAKAGTGHQAGSSSERKTTTTNTGEKSSLDKITEGLRKASAR